MAAQGAGKVGILAGGGDLPVLVAQACQEAGRGVYISRLGQTDARLAAYEGDAHALGEIGKRLKSLKAAGVTSLVMAGYVSRPDFSKLKLDLKGASILPGALKAAASGDDGLLRYLIGTLEKEGFEVLGADDLLRPLLAEEGLIAGPAPTQEAEQDIARAAHVAASVGALDIGQGAVSCRGLVLAVEAQEGTDAMLERVAGLPEPIRGSLAAPMGVLVKRPKPIQERRADLPVIGPSTIERLHAACLAGVAVSAGEVFILHRDEVRARAEALGVFVVGRRFAPYGEGPGAGNAEAAG